MQEKQWISIKDELPLEINYVLWCRVPVDEPYIVASMCDDGFDIKHWTHWRLLPEPPLFMAEPIKTNNGLDLIECSRCGKKCNYDTYKVFGCGYCSNRDYQEMKNQSVSVGPDRGNTLD